MREDREMIEETAEERGVKRRGRKGGRRKGGKEEGKEKKGEEKEGKRIQGGWREGVRKGEGEREWGGRKRGRKKGEGELTAPFPLAQGRALSLSTGSAVYTWEKPGSEYSVLISVKEGEMLGLTFPFPWSSPQHFKGHGHRAVGRCKPSELWLCSDRLAQLPSGHTRDTLEKEISTVWEMGGLPAAVRGGRA